MSKVCEELQGWNDTGERRVMGLIPILGDIQWTLLHHMYCQKAHYQHSRIDYYNSCLYKVEIFEEHLTQAVSKACLTTGV